MEFLGNLGIDWKLLIAQIVNFGVLVWILVRFVYRPIIRRIEKDETTLGQAEKANAKLERDRAAFDARKKKELADAKKRSGEIIEEAETIATEITEQARKEAAEERRAVVKQIRSRLADIDNASKTKR